MFIGLDNESVANLVLYKQSVAKYSGRSYK